MIYDINGNVISGSESIAESYGAISLNPFEADDSVSLISTYSNVIAAYDALVSAFPQYVTKNTLTQGSFTNYEYVFTTGNYNSYASHAYAMDAEIAKPKFLITAGIHGYERTTVMATLALFTAMCNGADGLQYLREAFEFHVIPVVNPYGYDHDSRYNANGVDLNRNFDASWTSQSYSGSSAASEDETKLIQAWIASHSTAKALIDFHNSEVVAEICLIQSIGTAAEAVTLKKSALYAMNNIIPHWEIDRQIPASTSKYFYTGVDSTSHGFLSMYSRDQGIPSFVMETSWNVKSTGKHSAFTIGVSAEALAMIAKGMSAQIESQ